MKKYKDLSRAEKEEITVTVCDHCNTAACWHGEFYCDKSKTAGIWHVPIYYLEQYGRECSDYWEFDIGIYFTNIENEKTNR